MHLYKRRDVWHCAYYDNEGRRIRRTTGCSDKKAAEARARGWERDAADPDHATARDATLSKAVEIYLARLAERVIAERRSQATHDSYTTKAGHLLRLFEHPDGETYVPFRLVGLTAVGVEDYITQRRREGVKDHTVHKELVVLRGVLAAAKGKGMWHGDIDAVIPRKFAPNYQPRTRFLTREELARLMGALRADRAAIVAFIVATSAEWSAVGRALRRDVVTDRSSLLVRGSKNNLRLRRVPIESPDQQRLLAFALDHAAGVDPELFDRWSNVRRELHAACDRVSITRCSPHDLRRTFASWMIQDGVPPHLIAKMMGHATSAMVERVYAQLRPQDLAGLVRGALERAA